MREKQENPVVDKSRITGGRPYPEAAQLMPAFEKETFMAAKLPRIPQAWIDQSAGTPPAASRLHLDLNNRSGGLLNDWQPPDWSPADSGPGFLLDPETIAQIDFGASVADSISGRGNAPVDRSIGITDTGNGAPAGSSSPKSSAQKGVTVVMGYKPLDDVDAADHSYIKIIGPDGREFFLRGGPGPDGDGAASGGVLGVLASDSAGSKSSYRGNAHLGDLTVDTGYDALRVERRKADDATKILGRVDMTFDQAMQKLMKFKDDVNAAKIKYWPLSTNSNAVSHQAATVLGLPRPTDPVWTTKSGFMLTPGAGVILTNRGRELGH